MKKLILVFLGGLFMLSACNNAKNSKGDSETADSTAKANTELPQNFYKRLEGTIAGKSVVMHLQRLDGSIDGEYYYDGAWLNLTADTLVGKDSLILTENSFNDYYFNQNAKPPILTLKWNGSAFTGNWQSGDKTKTYPIALSEKYAEGSYAFTPGIYRDSVKAFADKPKTPTAEISFEYLQANANDESGGWLNNQLKKISGIKSTNMDRVPAFNKIADAYFADYKKEITEQQRTGPDRGYMEWMNYTNNSQQSVLYNDNGFVVIDFLADTYTGGAHGYYSSLMYCLDVKEKKQMALSDIVKIDPNSLQNLLEKNLRKQYNIKAGDELITVLFDNFLKPNNNFYFNKNGLAFMYNPYEVASYAQGQIVVFIPFTELKPYLTPGFSSRIGLK